MPIPSYDPLRDLTEASNAGVALGSAIALNNYRQKDLALRRQQLQSEAALRRLQEQQLAQNMALQLAQHNQQVDMQADMTKAMAQVQLESRPTLPVQAPIAGPPEAGANPDLGSVTSQVPNPAYVPFERSMMNNVLPVIAKHRPQEVPTFVQDMAMYPYRMAEAKRQTALADMMSQGGGAGTIREVTGPNGQKLSVYAHPNGTTEIIGSGTGVPVTEAGGRQFYLDAKGIPHPLPQDVMKRMTIMALHNMVKDNMDLAIQNPNAPQGMLMPDPAKEEQLFARQTLTTAAKGGAEKQLMATEDAIRNANDALRTISEHPEAIGIAGAGRDLIERGQGQLGMDTGGAPVAKARHQLALAFTQLADGLKIDVGNMSRYERSKLELVGDPTRFQESPETADNMMRDIRRALVGKSLRITRDLGKQPNDAVLSRIEPSEVAGLLSEHLLSREAAERWWDLQNKK